MTNTTQTNTARAQMAALFTALCAYNTLEDETGARYLKEVPAFQALTRESYLEFVAAWKAELKEREAETRAARVKMRAKDTDDSTRCTLQMRCHALRTGLRRMGALRLAGKKAAAAQVAALKAAAVAA